MPRKSKKIRQKKTLIIALIIIVPFLLLLIIPAPVSGYWWVSTKGQMRGCGNSAPYMIYSFGVNESKMYSVWEKDNTLYIASEQSICGGSAMKKRGREYFYAPPETDLGEFVITPGWLYADCANVKKGQKNNFHWEAQRALNPFLTYKLLSEWEIKKKKEKAYQDRIR